MLTRREYWTITSLILVVVLMFQLMNYTRKSATFYDAGRENQSIVQELADDLSGKDEEK